MNSPLIRILAAAMLGLLAGYPASAADDAALPDDGGAPFAAYVARIAAIHAGDWSAWKQVTAAEEIAAEIAQAGSDEAAGAAFVETADYLRMMTPSHAEFVAGQIDGERAILIVRATRPTTQLRGDAAPIVINQVEMRQSGGRWYLETERLHSIAP